MKERKKNMSEKMKKILLTVAAVVLVVVCGLWFLNSDLEHIEDTNGPDDFSLTTITDENIINMDMGALTPVTIHHDIIGNGLTFSSDKFTGVYELLYDNYWGKSDFWLRLTQLEVTEGNFRMVVIHDGKIVADIEPNTENPFVDFLLEDITGTVSVRIAGESASYKFHMSESEYDDHSHP